MKTLIKAATSIAVFVFPIALFAQSNQPVSGVQVRAELIQIERAGYNPNDWIHYPENMQAAGARVAVQRGMVRDDRASYESDVAGISQVGSKRP